MYDIVALGESLIDFTPSGTNDMGMPLFSQNPGGAPANVLAMAAKMGAKTAFIGKVGNDAFGDFLIRNMQNANIDIQEMVRDKGVPTTLAFVQLNAQGDRSFSFYRNPGADIMLTKEQVPQHMVKNCKIFHFGSVSLTDEPCRSATIHAANIARQAGAVISFDPNYRPLLWETKAKAVAEILQVIPLANLLKVSQEEMELLTNTSDISTGAKLLSQMGPDIVVVTLGRGGALVYTKNAKAQMQTYDVKTIDTTGAGDAFWGTFLFSLIDKALNEISRFTTEHWISLLKLSNAAGSLTTTQKGAILAMPTAKDIETCISSTPLLQ